MKILVLAEHNDHALNLSVSPTVTAAQALHGTVDLLVIGQDCQSIAEQGGRLDFVNQVLIADNEVYAHSLAENSAVLIAEIGKNYDYILAAATTFGKNILPRAAALLDVAMVSDVTKILSKDTFERPIYAGNAIATVKALDAIKVLSIRTTAFARAPQRPKDKAPIVPISEVIANAQSRFISQALTQSKRPELSAAKIVIAGGRGLKSAANFHLLESLADRLGGAVGASRAAVDAGFAPNDYQIGQTGKVVAPDLYIAVGISGAVQHLAGMKESKVIVAINNDPEAPIFQIADYGLVGDLFKILPELQAELNKE